MAASDRIDELRRKFEENPRRYFAPLANEYRKAGDLETAIAICRRHLASFPEHISGHIVLGQALYEARRHAEAREVFETSLRIDPENLIALRHLGDIARAAGDEGAARNWYQRILEADPRNDDIAAQLASLAPAARGVPGFGDVLDRGVVPPPLEIPAQWAPVERTPGAAEPAPADVEADLIDFTPESLEPPGAGPAAVETERIAEGASWTAPEAEPAAESATASAGVAEPEFVDGWELPSLDPEAPYGAAFDPGAEPRAAEATADATREGTAPGEAIAVGRPEESDDAEDSGVPDWAVPPADEPAPDAAELPDWASVSGEASAGAPVASEPDGSEARVDEVPAREAAADEIAAGEFDVAAVAPEPSGTELRSAERPVSEEPGREEAGPEAGVVGEPFDPVVGLDVPPETDSGQMQLGAAELGSAELPAAERWAADLAAHDPVAAAAEEPTAEESPTEESPTREPPTAEPGAGPTAAPEPAVAEPVGETSAPETGHAPERAPERAPEPAAEPVPVASDDAHVGSSELSALASGAFATETLAELFVQQGHLAQAAAVYERLAAERPGDAELARRLASVRARLAGEPEPPVASEPVASEPVTPELVTSEAAATEPWPPEPAMPVPSLATSAGDFFAALAQRPGPPAEPSPESQPTRSATTPVEALPPIEEILWAEPAPATTGAHPATATAEPPPAVGGPASVLASGSVDARDERAASTLAAGFSGAGALGAPSLRDELALGVVAAEHPEGRDVPPAVGEDLSFDRFFAGFEDLLHRPGAAVPTPGATPSPLLEDAGGYDAAAVGGSGARAAVESGTGGRGTTAAQPEGSSDAAASDDLAAFNAWLRGLGEL